MSDSFNRAGRPVKFGHRSAALAAGLSLAGFHLLLRRNPSLKNLLRESSTNYRLRVLMWTFGERSTRNVRLSANLLVKEASLETTFMNRFYAASIIHFYSTAGADPA
jgi:hypothetical protein